MSENPAYQSPRPDPAHPPRGAPAGPVGGQLGQPPIGSHSFSPPGYRGSLPGHRSGWTTGPVLTLLLGLLIAAVGLGVTVGGASILGISAVTRDDGYVTTPHWSADSPGYAVVTGEAQLWGTGLDRGLGDVRVRAVALDGEELFVGIARATDTRAYLTGVHHTAQSRAGAGRHEVGGEPPTGPPAEAGIWIASGTGTVAEAVTPARPGTWVAVVMPTDGDEGIDAVVDVGATVPWLVPAGIFVTVLGLALFAGGALAMVAATRAATAPPRQHELSRVPSAGAPQSRSTLP